MTGMRDSYGSMSFSFGGDAWIKCATYPDGVHPILTISVAHLSLALSPTGHRSPLTAGDVAKARELGEAVAVYVAEIERLHTQQATGADTQESAAA